MTALRLLPAFFVVALAGCDRESRVNDSSLRIVKTSSPSVAPETAVRGEAAKKAAPARASAAQGRMAALTDKASITFTDGASATLVALQPGPTLPAGTPAISRKIAYDAQVDLIVDSVDPIATRVGTLVQQAGGYIAEQNVTGSPGTQRSMRWRVRIPVEKFDSFVESIVALGELERHNRTSQDVTEQYYDLEARIKNKRVEEKTLNKILEERTGKLEDVLKIEIELSRVRGEIEQLEGKIRVLENLASLATLTLNVREREKYAPPPPVVADFRTQVARTWDSSLLGLVNMSKALALWTVSWLIWIPLLLVVALLALVLLRYLLRVFLRNLPRLAVIARTPITTPRADGR